MHVKFLAVAQAFYEFEQLDSNDFSDVPEIICLSILKKSNIKTVIRLKFLYEHTR